MNLKSRRGRSSRRAILPSEQMAYFFRKSIGVGPFRLNLSKSGIGGSVGFKGLRLTRTARGATYVTAGRAGVYYRETLSGTAVATQNQTPAVLPNPGVPSDGTSRLPDSLLLDSTCEKLLAQLNERARIKNPAGLFYAAAILGLLAAVFYGSETALLAPSAFPALVLAVTAAALGVMVRLRSDAKRCTTLMYTLDSAEQDKHASVVQGFWILPNVIGCGESVPRPQARRCHVYRSRSASARRHASQPMFKFRGLIWASRRCIFCLM